MNVVFYYLLLLWSHLAFNSKAQLTYNPQHTFTLRASGSISPNSRYALFLTEQSVKNGNIFQFYNLTTANPLFMAVQPFPIVKSNITYRFLPTNIIKGKNVSFIPLDPTNTNSSGCQTLNMFFDCSLDSSPQFCSFLESQIPPIKSPIPGLIDCTSLSNYIACTSVMKQFNNTRYSGNSSTYNATLNSCFRNSSSVYITISAQIYIANLTLLPTFVTANSTASLNFLQLTAVTKNDWLVTASTDRLWTYPTLQSTSVLDSAFNSIPSTTKAYNTIYKMHLLEHNYSTAVFCQYNITHTGFIRNIDVNGYSYGYYAPTGTGLDTVSTVNSTERIQLDPQTLNIVTIIGFRINQAQIDFTNCTLTWDGNTIINNIQFNYSIYNQSLFDSQDRQIITTTGQCSSNCLKCSINRCLACQPSYVLFEGQCYTQCPNNAPFQSTLNSCTPSLRNVGVQVINPVINKNLVTINGYLDVPDTLIYAMVVYPTDKVTLTYTALTLLNGQPLLAESYPVILNNRNQGFYTVNVSLVDVLSLNNSSIGSVQVIYYELDPLGPSSLPGFYWSNQWLEFTNTTLNSSSSYIFYSYLNCSSTCSINVASNGNVQLIKNKRALLFDINFVNTWTYSYNQIQAGFSYLEFYVSNATSFKAVISGDNIITYESSCPYYSHQVGPLGASIVCNISNCMNCNGTICFSCNQKYFLTIDSKNCVPDCSTYSQLNNPIERRCTLSCTGSYINSNNSCIPKCDQPGYIYSNAFGCVPCVQNCLVCSTTTTCLQCQPYSIFIDPNICLNVSDIKYPDSTLTTNQTVQIKANFSNNYILMITTESIYKDLTFYFLNESRQVPKIIKVIKLNSLDLQTGTANIPALQFADTGRVFAHYIRCQENTYSLQNASLTNFYGDVLMDWPQFGINYQTNSSIGNVQSASNYSTTIASVLYQHNFNSQISCQCYFIYSGNIRKLYVNSQLIFFDSTIRYNTTKAEVYTQPVILAANEMVLVTIIGDTLTLNNLTFKNCSDGYGNQVSATFKSYTLLDQELSPSVFNVVQSTQCSQNCLVCINAEQCVQCLDGFYLSNGNCGLSCAAPLSKQSLFGLCDSVVRNSGYFYNYTYNSTLDRVSLSAFLPLSPNTLMVVEIHPYTAAYANYPKSEPKDSFRSLTEASYSFINYQMSNHRIDILSQVKNTASSPGVQSQPVSIDIYTVQRGLMLLAVWYTPPNSLEDKLQASYYEYLSSNNNSLTLQPNYTYLLSFYLNCTDLCSLTLNMTGDITIYMNERTFVFQSYFEENLLPVTLDRKFRGLNYFTMQVGNSTIMNFIFGGKYELFAASQFVLTDYRLLTSSSFCNISNCLNCYKNSCNSCNENFFLNSDGRCVPACPSNSTVLPLERVCTTNGCESESMYLVDNTCIWNCNVSGIYYGLSGCNSGNLCNIACKECFGPLSTQCTSCSWPHILTSNSTCVCPIGTKDDHNGRCFDPHYSVSISSEQVIESCYNFSMESKVEGIYGVNNITNFSWVLVNSTVSSYNEDLINTFLLNQHAKSVTIPSQYLETDQEYNFSIVCTNPIGQTATNWKLVQTYGDYAFNLTILGGDIKRFHTFESNAISLILNYSDCLSAITSVNARWSSIGSNYLELAGLYDPNDPLQLVIPACYQASSENFTLQATVWLANRFELAKNVYISINFSSGTFNSAIKGGNNGEILSSSDLVLTALIIPIEDCQTMQYRNVSYYWSCVRVNSSNNYNSGQYRQCADPYNIFNSSYSTPTLTIPSSYYSTGDVISIGLAVIKDGNIAVSNETFTVVDYYPLPVFINCQDCLIYKNQNHYEFAAQINDAYTSNNLFTYTWHTNPIVQTTTQNNQLIINPQNPPPHSSNNTLQITVLVYNTTHKGYDYKILLYDQPPQNGTLTVTPLIGQSMITIFTMMTNGWQQITNDYLLYQFSYAFSDENIFYPLSLSFLPKQTFSTPLPAKYPSSTILVRLTAQNSMNTQATLQTSITVKSSVSSLNAAVSQSQQLFSSNYSEYDPANAIIQTSIMTQELYYWEDVTRSRNFMPACPSCSNHGYCPQNILRCSCNIGWGLSDCSLQKSNLDQVVALKTSMLQLLQSSARLLPPQTNTEVVYSVLQKATSHVDFNTNSTLTLVESILENTLNLRNGNGTLDLYEANAVAQILNNMLVFTSLFDCSKQTIFTQNLEDRISNYFAVVSQSMLNNGLSTINGSVITTATFDIYVERTSLCSLANTQISTSLNAPIVYLNINLGPNTNCSQLYDIQYYALSNNFLSCNVSLWNITKEAIGLIITDSQTGEVFTTGVTVTMQMPFGDPCPTGCDTTSPGKCQCKDISIFDIKSQIQQIFSQSQLQLLLKYEAILSFMFWRTGPFWSLIIFTLWFFISLYVVKFKRRDFNIIDNYKHSDLRTRRAKIKTLILATHPIFNIYYYQTKSFSKSARVVLYYARTLLLLTFVSVFSHNDSTSVIAIPSFSDIFQFNLYQFLLPYLTVIPLQAILGLVLRRKIKSDMDVQQRRNLCRLIITAVFTFAIIGGCLVIILIITANQSQFQLIAWTVNFVQSLLQDTFINPITTLLIQSLCVKILDHQFFTSKPKLRRRLARLVDEALWEIQEASKFYKVRQKSTILERRGRAKTVLQHDAIRLKELNENFKIIGQSQSESVDNELFSNRALLKGLSFDAVQSPQALLSQKTISSSSKSIIPFLKSGSRNINYDQSPSVSSTDLLSKRIFSSATIKREDSDTKVQLEQAKPTRSEELFPSINNISSTGRKWSDPSKSGEDTTFATSKLGEDQTISQFGGLGSSTNISSLKNISSDGENSSGPIVLKSTILKLSSASSFQDVTNKSHASKTNASRKLIGEVENIQEESLFSESNTSFDDGDSEVPSIVAIKDGKQSRRGGVLKASTQGKSGDLSNIVDKLRHSPTKLPVFTQKDISDSPETLIEDLDEVRQNVTKKRNIVRSRFKI